MVNEDDPFLKFLDYSQQKIDDDYQRNDITLKYPLAQRITLKDSKNLLEEDPAIKLKVKTMVRAPGAANSKDIIVDEIYNSYK